MTLRRIVVAALLLCAVMYRQNIVAHFSSSSPDGDQYIALGRGVRNGTLGFGGGPSYARMPGYPLVLATLVGDARRAVVVKRAAHVNALLDVGSAVAVFLIAAELGIGWLAVVLVIIAPPLVLFSTMSLTESLATFLGTWALAAAVLRRPLLCGALLGAALLVRIDSLTFLPGLLVLLGWRRAGWLALGTLLVWAPWPVRNVVDFGAPHPAAAEWPAQDGTPLLTGPIHWMRTWSSSAPGEQAFADAIVFAKRCPDEGLLPAMWTGDDRAALRRVAARCHVEGLTPSVNEDFERLAAQRCEAHPLHVYVTLPLERVLRLWSPPPEREVHWMHLPEAGLPSAYWVMQAWYALLYVGALVGAVLLWKRQRTFVIAAVAILLARSALHAFAVPHYEGFRYWVEIIPLLCVLAGATLPVMRKKV
ncbi:MAG: hypothetical protein ABI321_12035 [Polyangia bacterium]